MPATSVESRISDPNEASVGSQASSEPTPGEATSLQLAMAAAQVAHDNRGEDIVVLDLRELTPIFDYFVLATGTNRRQLHAISEEIDHRLEDDLKEARMGIEGYRESQWILLDYGSIVVHLFDSETREFYAIEGLWTDAKRVPLPWDEEGTSS
ncbi:MAG: ribosome silencing factor [Planctomycetota bacterium]